jgi:hypothetical protein
VSARGAPAKQNQKKAKQPKALAARRAPSPPPSPPPLPDGLDEGDEGDDDVEGDEGDAAAAVAAERADAFVATHRMANQFSYADGKKVQQFVPGKQLVLCLATGLGAYAVVFVDTKPLFADALEKVGLDTRGYLSVCGHTAAAEDQELAIGQEVAQLLKAYIEKARREYVPVPAVVPPPTYIHCTGLELVAGSDSVKNAWSGYANQVLYTFVYNCILIVYSRCSFSRRAPTTSLSARHSCFTDWASRGSRRRPRRTSFSGPAHLGVQRRWPRNQTNRGRGTCCW